MGNLKSVSNAFHLLGEKCIITDDEVKIQESDAIILPGVGAFSTGYSNLKKKQLDDILTKEVIRNKKPYLGICLGLEFLAKQSLENGIHTGLGWIDGEVIQIKVNETEKKLPHMGWNDTKILQNSKLFENMSNPIFYYLHSYYLKINNPDKTCISGTCKYGSTEIVSSIEKENIFAVQFHPEKSQSTGLQLLKNFINVVKSA